ncbi:hypothetical protein GCM10011613_27610 [Cellvibrio zantedeschiae]|uniref:Uncharacterized protein n=1 Tax=Cellvibrio zantedeschiae TaxID=1237077 RepID=A0ABQ3B5T9_9GAMM|nr:hypothetical protein [Cellvibrio zantedeschiae]GGY81033.1 hypothetical protein GCM10011613_27610 [Cellvibrio zantedeschiae]
MASIYIEILKFGKNQISTKESGFKKEELTNHLKVLGYGDNDLVNIQYFLDNAFVLDTSPPNLYKIRLTALEYLIDYDELEEARNSSRSALNFAMASLIITILGSVGAMYMSHIQINSDVTINRNQFDLLSSDLKNIGSTLKITNENVDHVSAELKGLRGEVKTEILRMESTPKLTPKN